MSDCKFFIIETFRNWIKPSSMNEFRKLYGKIDESLSSGEYQIKLTHSCIVFN